MSGSLSDITRGKAQYNVRTDSPVGAAANVITNRGNHSSAIITVGGNMKINITAHSQDAPVKSINTIQKEVSAAKELVETAGSIFIKAFNGNPPSTYIEKCAEMYGSIGQHAKDSEFKETSTFSTHKEKHITAVERFTKAYCNVNHLSDRAQRFASIGATGHDTGMGGMPKNGISPKSGLICGYTSAMDIRKHHAVMSGAEILRNGNLIHSGSDHIYGALAAAAHSKSNSGVARMNDPSCWKELVANIKSELIKDPELYNRFDILSAIHTMDSLFSRGENGETVIAPGKEEIFRDMVDAAKAISYGDFCAHTYGTGEGYETQAGEHMNFDSVPITDPAECANHITNMTPAEETKGTVIVYTTDPIVSVTSATDILNATMDGKVVDIKFMDGHDPSATFPLGEGNIKIDPPHNEPDGRHVLTITIQDMTICPASTNMAIQERIKELPRMQDPYKVEINFEPKNLNHSSLNQSYMNDMKEQIVKQAKDNIREYDKENNINSDILFE